MKEFHHKNILPGIYLLSKIINHTFQEGIYPLILTKSKKHKIKRI